MGRFVNILAQFDTPICISLVLSLNAFSELFSVTNCCYWRGNNFPLQPFTYVECWGGQAMTSEVEVVRC